MFEMDKRLANDLTNFFAAANQIAKDDQDEFLSTEVVLLALYKPKGQSLDSILVNMISSESKERIDQLRGGSRVTSQNQEETYEALLVMPQTLSKP